MGENWKRGFRIGWYLFGPLLLYALLNDSVMLCWMRVRALQIPIIQEIPDMIPASAVSAAGLWFCYRNVKKVSSNHSQNLGKWGFLVAAAAASCIFLNHLFVFVRVPYQGYDKVKHLVFDLNLVWQIVGSGLLVPLAEELVFRGLGYLRLRREMDVLPSAVFTAVLFGVYHGNWIQGIYAFLTGMLLAFVYEAYGSLAAAWLFHAAANLTAILLTNMPVWSRLCDDLAAAFVMTVIGGVILFGFVVQIREDIK
ncbi:MAG: lysostaphin resistance A-like protein [Brotaphodocola sp.]